MSEDFYVDWQSPLFVPDEAVDIVASLTVIIRAETLRVIIGQRWESSNEPLGYMAGDCEKSDLGLQRALYLFINSIVHGEPFHKLAFESIDVAYPGEDF